MRVVLDAGHGGYDSGAVSGGLKEKDLTLKIVKLIRDKLVKNYIVDVYLTREKDEYISLTNRSTFANVCNADLVVSVHINAGGGTGYESFIHPNVKNNSEMKELQKLFHRQNILRDRGMKTNNFSILRLTNMPAILTENGFIDNQNDMAIVTKKLNEIADFHVKAIVDFLKLKKKSNKKLVYYIESGGFIDPKTCESMLKLFIDKGYYAVIKERYE